MGPKIITISGGQRYPVSVKPSTLPGFTGKTEKKYHQQKFNIPMSTLNSAVVPDWRSDSMFPGSRYAMLIRKPGPVNAQRRLKLKLYYMEEINWG